MFLKIIVTNTNQSPINSERKRKELKKHDMRKIEIYDYEAEIIDELCEKYEASEAQIVEALIAMMSWHDEDDLGEYM